MIDMRNSLTLDSLISKTIDIPKVVQSIEHTLDETIPFCRAIVTALILAIRQDIEKIDSIQFAEDVGWRNGYNIHLLSGVPQKEVYNENGVLAKLVEAEIVQKRSSQSRWGKQRYHFRLSIQHH